MKTAIQPKTPHSAKPRRGYLPGANMARKMLSLAMLAFSLACAGETSGHPYGQYAFDSSISNDFWCTWGWVAPEPAEGVSATVAPFDFCGPVFGESNAVAPFRRAPRIGLVFTIK